MTASQTLAFTKMQGSGNDFALIDNRDLAIAVTDMADLARAICPRCFSVGADGCIFLEAAPEGSSADYRWHFFNADGSRAEMCGNASRCAAKLAVQLGMAGPEHVLHTDAGPISARLLDDGQVRVQLTRPFGLILNTTLPVSTPPGLGDTEYELHSVNTGVPHVVLFSDELEGLDVQSFGSSIRYHEHFSPAGTNANFAKVTGADELTIRTYERGVEGETLACGTGAAAAGLISHALGLVGPSITVRTWGGETLGIDVDGDDVFLTGQAVKVYTGVLSLDSLPEKA
ncbi:MAG: diaminopimelate epimerase [Desulfovibrio sp.]|nr:MAG: diaminopimelate epimerase [Desulfovibrio sp.]